jgi:hypothetical protein
MATPNVTRVVDEVAQGVFQGVISDGGVDPNEIAAADGLLTDESMHESCARRDHARIKETSRSCVLEVNVPQCGVKHIIGIGGRKIKAWQAINGIHEVGWLHQEDQHLNSDRKLNIKGTVVACEAVQKEAVHIVEICKKQLLNDSRQHHTGDIVNGRALKVKDVHPEVKQRNLKQLSAKQRGARREREVATEQQAKWKEVEAVEKQKQEAAPTDKTEQEIANDMKRLEMAREEREKAATAKKEAAKAAKEVAARAAAPTEQAVTKVEALTPEMVKKMNPSAMKTELKGLGLSIQGQKNELRSRLLGALPGAK